MNKPYLQVLELESEDSTGYLASLSVVGNTRKVLYAGHLSRQFIYQDVFEWANLLGCKIEVQNRHGTQIFTIDEWQARRGEYK